MEDFATICVEIGELKDLSIWLNGTSMLVHISARAFMVYNLIGKITFIRIIALKNYLMIFWL